jgi:hypothetical protein
MSGFELRLATMQDVQSLHSLIAAACRQLTTGDYTQEQIEAAIGSAWGVDTQLISDATYFVAHSGHEAGVGAARCLGRTAPAEEVQPSWSRGGMPPRSGLSL